MSRFIPIELHHASRLLNHGPTVMITSFDEQSQRRNIMAAAWSMPVASLSRALQQLTGRGQWEACRVVKKINLIAMAFRW